MPNIAKLKSDLDADEYSLDFAAQSNAELETLWNTGTISQTQAVDPFDLQNLLLDEMATIRTAAASDADLDALVRYWDSALVASKWVNAAKDPIKSKFQLLVTAGLITQTKMDALVALCTVDTKVHEAYGTEPLVADHFRQAREL